MFHPITIPFDCVMLFNRVHLKEGVTAEDIELELGYKLLWQGEPEDM